MTKRSECVEKKKVDASIHLNYKEKESAAAVISYSLECNNCFLLFFGITSFLVIDSLLDLE